MVRGERSVESWRGTKEPRHMLMGDEDPERRVEEGTGGRFASMLPFEVLRSRWMVPLMAALVHALHAACVYIGPATLLSPIRQDLGLTVSQVSMPLNAYRIVNALFLAPAGMFLDAYGAETPMKVSIVSAGVLSFAFPASHSLLQLVVVQTLLAVTKLFGGLTTMLILISQVFTKDNGLGTATSILLGGYSAAGFIAPLVVGLMGEKYGWRMSLVFLSTLFAVIAVPIAVLFLGVRRNTTAVAPLLEPPSWANSATVFTKSYTVLILIVMSFTTSMHIILDYLVIFLTEHIGFSLKVASLYMSILNLVALFAKVLAGVLGDRYDKTILLPIFGAVAFVGSLLLFDFDTISIPTITSSRVKITCFVPIYAIGYAGVFNLTTALLPEFGIESLGLRSNINLMVLFGAGSLGSYSAGALRTASKSYRWSFVLNTSACGAVIVFSLLFRHLWNAQDRLQNAHDRLQNAHCDLATPTSECEEMIETS